MLSRRKVLRRSAAVSVTLGLAGCVDSLPGNEPTSTVNATEMPTETPTDELQVENPEPVSEEVFTEWEPDTNCKVDKPESMYNSEVSVQSVLDEQPDSVNPIPYESLPDGERRIIAEVLEVGGYATCDTSEAFQSFLEKAVYDYADKQEGDATNVWLEYEKNYYKLYIRKQDQVYAY